MCTTTHTPPRFGLGLPACLPVSRFRRHRRSKQSINGRKPQSQTTTTRSSRTSKHLCTPYSVPIRSLSLLPPYQLSLSLCSMISLFVRGSIACASLCHIRISPCPVWSRCRWPELVRLLSYPSGPSASSVLARRGGRARRRKESYLEIDGRTARQGARRDEQQRERRKEKRRPGPLSGVPKMTVKGCLAS